MSVIVRKYHFKKIPLGAQNFLSVLEGAEGGFAIFAGIVVGLSFQNTPRELLIAAAIVSLVVNAFNASAVRFTSEHFIDELDGHEKRHWYKAYLWPAVVEFSVYLVVSIIAVLPLIAIADRTVAVTVMAVMTLVFLFLAGWYRGRVTYNHTWRDGIEVLLSGGLIILVGGIAGYGSSLLLV